jgi:hypothetical protein
MTNIYSEILKMDSFELNNNPMNEQFYNIPLTPDQLKTVMDLLTDVGENAILNDIRVFLNEEYGFDYVPFYEFED